MNGKAKQAGITVATQHLVHTAIRDLEYTPNRMASAVVTGRSRIIGVVSALSREIFSTQFGSRVLSGFMRGMREKGYHLIFLEDIIPGKEPDQQRLLREATEMCLEGIILLMDLRHHDQVIDPSQWHPLPLPMVSVQFTFDPGHAPGFRVNHEHAVQACMGHLIEMGHRKIGFGARSLDFARTQSTQNLISKCLREYDLNLPTNQVFELAHKEDARRAINQVRQSGITAIFTLYDPEAVRLMTWCWEQGLSVPRDLSIIGYGDFVLAGDVYPPLTTYRPPMEEIGFVAIQYLLECIEMGKQPEAEGLHDLVGHLVVRSSTAPP
jgi:DNA-binding LacI/PurR family transcriptional regulator